MFKTIIWATDGSATADRALPYARELAGGPDRALVVVHAMELLIGYPVHPDEEALLAKIEAQVEEIEREGVAVTLRIAPFWSAGPAHFVAEIADEVGADLIVVGTHGHGPLTGMLLGSVAQHLLHDATCPVLAVPPSRATKAIAAEREAGEGRVATTASARRHNPREEQR